MTRPSLDCVSSTPLYLLYPLYSLYSLYSLYDLFAVRVQVKTPQTSTTMGETMGETKTLRKRETESFDQVSTSD